MERRKFLKFFGFMPFFPFLERGDTLRKPGGSGTCHLEAKLRQILLAEFFIAGFQYHEGVKSEIFQTLKESEELVLQREPDNPHDPLAIAIFTKGGHKLGYVPRACNYSPALIADQDVRLCAEIAEIDPNAEPWERVLVRLWEEV